ncbi:MAG: polymer-forming cytoskeletal protein [Nitrospira sp.]|nr:polymer-forming cytoskeletal protein [Nitrospira sp.]MDH4369424.1 polymer-forming cytoskeletal protein [Nitrospira sp.]MDH5346646.1 polymer-forming cytoskeletal protein [Nitrospira sp.]MDH5497574.1 polymer-forming cytoskeletal protein [Nitrospira sp.]
MWKQDEVAGEEEGRERERERERERWVEDRRSPLKGGPTLPDEVAFVGKDVEFKGVITYSGTVRIDGALDGEIHTDGGLLVGPEAVLKAKVTAGTVVCHGNITGDIQATKQIVLCAPAVVQGSLTTPVLSMEEGVVFNGTLEMKPQAKAEGLREVGPYVGTTSNRPQIRLAA